RMVEMLDDTGASRAQRERLITALATTGWANKVDKSLTDAMRDVFDPNGRERSFGSALMPITSDRYIELIEARILGVERARGLAPWDELQHAWFQYRLTMRSYAAVRPELLATSIRPQDAAIWQEPTADHLVNNSCYHLITILGGWARLGNPPTHEDRVPTERP